MRDAGLKFCALVLALSMVPGIAEAVENTFHLVTEGHLAHGETDGDRHEPAGPEHGCSPVFHACGCHASLSCAGEPPILAIGLPRAGLVWPAASEHPLAGLPSSVDRPPQV